MLERPPWTDKYKQNWDDAYWRIMAWWHGEPLDRPVLLNAVRRANLPADITERRRALGDIALRDPRRFDLDAELQLEQARLFLQSHHFHAESAPFARTGYASSLGLLVEAAGGAIRYTPETGTSWSVEDPAFLERPLPELSPDCAPYAFALDMISRYHREFGFDIVLGANPLMDPLTTLSMLLGNEDLAYAIVDEPELVQRWVARLGDLYLQIAASYRSARAALGRREDFNWLPLWCPGDMDSIECDYCALISQEMFRRFGMPEAERQTQFFDYCFWHLDGSDEIKHLDDILSLKQLNAVQWVDQKKGNPVAYAPMFEKIRGAGKSVVTRATPRQALELCRTIGPDGLAFVLIDDAKEVIADEALLLEAEQRLRDCPRPNRYY